MFDGAGDARLLPFEGYGAVSVWALTLAPASNAFDVQSVSDVLLHVRYTAKSATPESIKSASDSVSAAFLPAYRLLSLRADFGDAFELLTAGIGAERTVKLDLGKVSRPFGVSGDTPLAVERLGVASQAAMLGTPGALGVKVNVIGAPKPVPLTLVADDPMPEAPQAGVLFTTTVLDAAVAVANGVWTLEFSVEGTDQGPFAALDDVLLLVRYGDVKAGG